VFDCVEVNALSVRLVESWLKNTVLTEMLSEKNTIPAEKKEAE